MDHWEGFLPKRSILMAKNRSLAPPSVESSEETSSLFSQAIFQEPPQAIPQEAVSHELPPVRDVSQILLQISQELQGCTRCKLCSGRKNIVFGEGNPHAELVFIGEGPGEQEDIQGRPFVGKAGQLLDRMIGAIGLKREQVFIANVVKCRPPMNRNPEGDEIQLCSPFLYRQIDAIRPKVVVALGKFAAQTLLQTEERISQLRGRFRPYRGAKLMPTFHPAYLLRNPASKREAWEDLKLVAAELGIQIPVR